VNESLPVEEPLFIVNNRWAVSSGGVTSAAKNLQTTEISVLGSQSGITEAYVGGEKVPFQSEFSGSNLSFANNPSYFTAKINSSSGEYVGWVKLQYENTSVLITDFCFYQL